MIDYSHKTDEELVALVLDNQDNFLYLIRRYEQKLKRYIRRISNITSEDAEDLLQEIFIKVYENLNSFDQSLKFSSWIYRISRNHVISHFRKIKARPQMVDIYDNEEILNSLKSDLDVAEDTDKAINKEVLLKAINQLNNKYKEVLILNFFEDKDYKEISDILKKPMGTVATLLSRAKKNLNKIIKEQEIKF